MEKALKNIGSYFLLACLLGVFYFSYTVLKPFLFAIIIAAVFVVIFYPFYQRLLAKMPRHPGRASLIICLLIALLIIVPLINFLIILSAESVQAYSYITDTLGSDQITKYASEQFWQQNDFLRQMQFLDLQKYAVDAVSAINSFIVGGATSLVKGTTSFLTNMVFMLLTMFFFFRDGKFFAQKIKHLSPLANKYDEALFNKFQHVSHSVLISVFASSVVQSITATIGFVIVGVPALFLGVAVFFASLIPFVGSALIWVPTGILLVAFGQTWQGIFLLLYGVFVISLIDNVLRPMMMKGETQIHPLLILFSILGGIKAYGFAGIFIGPLIIALTLTFLYIYELEYKNVLE